jgi:hypothetical protein
MTNEDPLMDDEQAGDAVAKYLEENPELLQGIVPAHDLWPAIESRISARVIPMQATTVRVARRSLGWMPMLIAASALVVASAGITYVLTARTGSTGMPGVQGSVATATTLPAATLPADTLTTGAGKSQRTVQGTVQGATQLTQSQPGETPAVQAGAGVRGNDALPATAHMKRPAMQLASRGDGSATDQMRETYDSEITTLHHALEARRGQLNPSTVAIIEQNLSVIDEAIRQSKAALAKDPNSRLLNDQLDRTLAKKTILLRAAALLPSA